MRRLGALAAALAFTAGVGISVAGADDPPDPPNPGCGNGAGETHVTFSGTFDTSDEGAYVFVPFTVPTGTTRVRTHLTHTGIDLANPVTKHTLDLGLYQPRTGSDPLWGEAEFRGWGGSSRLNACVSAKEATVGFLPGPIIPGQWAAEIGVAAVAGPDEGDSDGRVDWTLDVFLSADPAHETPAWTPVDYDEAAALPDPGWYAGDFHVHARHSNPGDAAMSEVFDYAFSPIDEGGAGLDFLTLSDYVTTRHWDDIGRFQARHPGKLIIRSAEVITYRGHINNHASVDWADYRTGDVYRREADGSLTLLRPAADHTARDVFDEIHANGTGWTQVNHPTTFPSKVPAFGNLCRGCSWEYSDAETDWSRVDAFEVHTGPAGSPEKWHGQQPDQLQTPTDGTVGPNPFTPPAIEWWDRLQREGHDITGVAVSDSHRASRQELLFSPVGEGTTVVFADELSEQGIRRGILAGHAFVKLFGNHGPNLRLTARRAGTPGPVVMMGDEIEGKVIRFEATVIGKGTGPGPLTLVVLRDGVPIRSVPVTGETFTHRWVATLPGDYRIQVQRGSAIEALTNPINVERPIPGTGAAEAGN